MVEIKLPQMITGLHKVLVKDKGWVEIKDLTEKDKQDIIVISDKL